MKKMGEFLSVLILPLSGMLGTLSGCGSANVSEALNAGDYAIIDLHLHLDGSLSPDVVRELAAMQGIKIPESDKELLNKLQVDEDCKDLNEYLEKFDFPLSLLQTKEAVSMAVYKLVEELKEQGMIYAEIRFAPQLHIKKGLSQDEVVKAAIAGMKKSDFHSNLILCCMRGDGNKDDNLETVRIAKNYLGSGVCAVDLAGAEALYPTSDFEELFALAKQLEIPYTIHAGEADGPQSVYKALEFGTKRIGHGVRSLEDEKLIKRLADDKIALELCPTSNLNTNIFGNIGEYPLRKLMQAGVMVTVNTDNMTVSGVTLQSEYKKLMDTFSLTREELKTIVMNSADASFADKETKEWIYGEIEKRFCL